MLLFLSFLSGIGAGLYLGIVIDVRDPATQPDIQSAGQGSSSEPTPM